LGVVAYPLRYDSGWHIDIGALREAVTPRCRAIVLVHPNNPTGSFVSRDELRTLESLCATHDLALISDEVFADYVFADRRGRMGSLASVESTACFTLGGLSKSCGLPQLKLGWIGVHGPKRLRDEALERLETIADTYLSVGTPIQLAAPALLARLPELQAPIRERIETNRARLDRALGADSPVSVLAAEGGWSAVLRVPATLPEEQMVLRLLDEEALQVHPGYFFDFASEAFLVLSLLPTPRTFAEGVQRLSGAVERWSRSPGLTRHSSGGP
jgi:alanine-synthesizing transaminase